MGTGRAAGEAQVVGGDGGGPSTAGALLPDRIPHTQPAPAQEAALELEGGERASLDGELSAAASSLPRSLRLLPLLSCVAVARGHRRRGVARELCLALQAEARPWGRVS